ASGALLRASCCWDKGFGCCTSDGPLDDSTHLMPAPPDDRCRRRPCRAYSHCHPKPCRELRQRTGRSAHGPRSKSHARGGCVQAVAEVIVIGAGPAGGFAAYRAAGMGAKTTLITRDEFG